MVIEETNNACRNLAVCACVRARAFACVMILINVHLAYREGDWRRVVSREIEASFLSLVMCRAWVLAVLTFWVMLRRS
jgi:hypothetical protein